MNKQIFVVEGKNDANKLKSIFPNINVVSVGGSALNESSIKYLKSVENDYEIIICSDPDYPGLKIRRELENLFPNSSHIFIERNKAFSKNKKKIGLEHLSNNEIIKLFKNIYQPNKSINMYQMNDLYQLGISGKEDSKALRDLVSKELNFGSVNAKTFLKRLNNSNYNLDDIIKIINKRGVSNASS